MADFSLHVPSTVAAISFANNAAHSLGTLVTVDRLRIAQQADNS